MSASEIIEEIKKLPRDEQQKIAIYFDEIQRKQTGKSESSVSEEFKRIADEAFRTNDELFRKLAK